MAAIKVEVVYALPAGADSVVVTLAPGATAGQAVRASGILARHPTAEPVALGIYGRLVSAQALLADGDRVEIYRPLVADPKEARRRRAARKP